MPASAARDLRRLCSVRYIADLNYDLYQRPLLLTVLTEPGPLV